MAGSYQAGAAFVTIAPSFQGLQSAIKGEFERYGDEAGRTFGDRWERASGDRIQAALDSLPRVEIDADSSEADRKLDELRARLEMLGAAEIGVDLDAGEAQAELEAIRAELQALDAEGVDLSVDLDASRAIAELIGLEQAVSAVDGRKADVAVDADTARADAALKKLGSTLDGLATKGLIGSAIGAGLAGIIPVAGAAAAAVVGLGAALAGLGAGLGVLGLAIAPVVKAMAAQDAATSSSAASSDAAGKAAQRHAEQVQAAAERVQDAQRGVAEATTDAAESDEDAARRVRDAQDGVQRARERAAEQTVQAQQKVTDAVEQAAAADEAAARRVQDAQESVAKAHADATRRVQDSQESLARTQQDAARRIRAAEESVSSARAKAARDAQSAADRVQTAERSLVAAQDRARDAQEALTRARKDAARAMEDLNVQVRRGALDERGAVLALQDAQDELANLGPTALEVARAQQELAEAQRTAALDHGTDAALRVQAAREQLSALQASVGGSDEDRKKAQLALERAQMDLEEVRRRNADLAAEKREADRAGVEGSKRVQDALEGVRDAQSAVGDAQQGVRDARSAADEAHLAGLEGIRRAEQAVTEAREAGAEQVARAERALADARGQAVETHQAGLRRIRDAQDGLARTQRDAARSVQDAERRLADARQQQARTHLDGIKRIEDAQRQLAKAQDDLAKARADAPDAGGAGAGGGMSKLSDAMSKLTPEGKAFLGLLNRMKGGVEELSRTAQRTALPGLTAALQSLAPAFGPVNDLVGRLGAALGKLAQDGAAQLRGPFWTGFGRALSEQLPGWLDKGARILGNFGKAFAGVFKAMLPVGNSFLDWLLRFSRNLAKSSQDAEKSQGFKKFLEYIRTTGPQVGRTFAALSAAVVKIIKDLAPLGPVVLQAVEAFAKLIAAAPPGRIREITVAVAALSAGLKALKAAWGLADAISPATTAMLRFKAAAAMQAALSGLATGLRAIGTAAKALGAAFLTPPLGIVVAIAAVAAGLVALYKHNEQFRKFVDGVVAKAKELGTAAFDWIRDKAAALVGWFKENWTTVLAGLIGGPFGLAVKLVHDNWGAIQAKVKDGAGRVKAWLVDNWQRAVSAALGKAFDVAGAIREKWEGMERTVSEKARDIRASIEGFVREWGGKILGWNPGEQLGRVWNGAAEWLRGPIDAVKRMIQPILDMIDRIASWRPPTISMPSMPWMPWNYEGGFPRGVEIPGLSGGGIVPGTPPARRGVDNLLVPIIDGAKTFLGGLRSGEFVQPQESVEYYGTHFMEAIRRRVIQREHVAGLMSGAYVGPVVPQAPQVGLASGGLVGGAARSIVSSPARAAGPLVATIDPGALQALLAQGDRPIVVQVDGRQLYTTAKQSARRYGSR